ncbi:HNH endonuclease signature motif containing protein [Pseudanabaena sp. FACHB-2040]|uniref:HNH endonuclease n=1 Tax=Pseudanabaena sp. FACHB-2040 TaxID=2692859 RepID=UPI00168778F3|nr:HNH endonuclease signature motif containing protein [Pseudanabaena sp. FACHB-2040]MBD2261254.1 HNH endonuclease [Pseudanabaena sp. FACHB-2040]
MVKQQCGYFPYYGHLSRHDIKRQKGRCNAYNLIFRDADVIELDHIIPRSLGGLDISANWQLLHRHYHHTKSAAEQNSVRTRGV